MASLVLLLPESKFSVRTCSDIMNSWSDIHINLSTRHFAQTSAKNSQEYSTMYIIHSTRFAPTSLCTIYIVGTIWLCF